MRKLINYIDKNLLLKIASLNSISVIIRVVVGFLTSKALALYVGPSGMAIVGNLRDFLTALRSISTLGFYNGIVKFIAQFKDDLLNSKRIISTTIYCILIFSVFLSILCYLNSDYLNDIILNQDKDYSFIFKLIALAIPFYSANTLLLAVLNGSSRFKFLIVVSIVGQIIAGGITVLLIWKYSLNGALVALVISEIILLIIAILGSYKRINLDKLFSIKYFVLGHIKKLGSFSIMAIFTATLLPLAYVFIRNYLINNLGAEEAGLWEAMNRISKYYLMFISTLLTLYILPRFSEIKSSFVFRKEILNFYKNIIPVFILGLVVIYFCRKYIVLIVLTEDFSAMEELFIWQLAGDLIKVLSLVISFQFLAKRMLWPFLISESISILILLTSSMFFIDEYGVAGANMAHLFTYIIYYSVLLFIFRNTLFGKKEVIFD